MAADIYGFKCSTQSLQQDRGKSSNLDPFWATRLWQHLIQHVSTDVSVGRHRHIFKHYDDVFDGVNIVDSVFRCLTKCGLQNVPKKISRENAIKVCQVLMNNGLFESVVPKGNKKFEDGTLRLYRFIKDVDIESSRSQDSDKENEGNGAFPSYDWGAELSRVCSSEKINDCQNQNYFKSRRLSARHVNRSMRHPAHRDPLSHIESPVLGIRENTRLLAGGSVRGLTARKSRPQPVHLVHVSAHSYGVPDIITEETHSKLHNCALMHLLAVSDIPVLEGILSVPDNLLKTKCSSPQLVIENCSVQSTEMLQKYGSINCIPWVSAAFACLDGRYPQGVGHLWSLQACKILCYQSVVERFNNSTCCIIPNSFTPICTSVIELLKAQRRSKALIAAQLFMMVLPWQRRQQLRFLLEFLHLVIEDIFVSVDKKVTNYEAVSRDFLDAIMQHPCVAKENFQILFDFMVYKVKHIFQVPECLKSGRDLSFCRRISSEDIAAITACLTADCLQKLAYIVMDSTELKLPEKKQWLKKLKKCHPEIHEQCACG